MSSVDENEVSLAMKACHEGFGGSQIKLLEKLQLNNILKALQNS